MEDAHVDKSLNFFDVKLIMHLSDRNAHLTFHLNALYHKI